MKPVKEEEGLLVECGVEVYVLRVTERRVVPAWEEEGRKAVLLLDIGKRTAPRAAVEERLVRNMLCAGWGCRWMLGADTVGGPYGSRLAEVYSKPSETAF